MKKLRRLSLLLVLELGCMGAAMPGIVESERADITVNYFVLKTTGVEELNQAIIESTSYSKKTVDIVEKNGAHFTAAFIASNNSEVYEANASVENDIVVDVPKGGVTVNLYYTETGNSSVAFIDQSDRLVVSKTYANGASLSSGDITEARQSFEANLPSGYQYGNITDETGNHVAEGLKINTDRLFTVNSSKIADYDSFDVLVQRDSGVESSRVAFDEIATVTSTNENFSYWAIGEKIVSYEKEYSFSVYSDTVIKEVCGEAVEKKPIVTLQRDNIADTGMNNIYEVKYEIPAGFELVETGMIFGGTTLETATSKVVARRITSNNEYSVRSAANGDHRAYLIYKKDGKLKVIYDDGYGVEQLVFNYDSKQGAELNITNLEGCITSSHSNIGVTGVTKVYAEDNGLDLKLGTSKVSGNIVINSDSEITFDKVVVNAKKYGSDTGKITVTGAAEEIAPTTDYSQLSFDLTTPRTGDITVGTNSKRAYVNYIELYYSNRAKEFSLTGLTLGDLSKVFNDIELPAEYDGYPVTWTSSNPSVISETGVVTCPESGSVEVELTATCNGKEKLFAATVYSSKEAANSALESISITKTKLDVEDIKVDLPTEVGDALISWKSSDVGLITAKGAVIHPESDDNTHDYDANGYTSVTLTPTAKVGKTTIDGSPIEFLVAKKQAVVGLKIDSTTLGLGGSYSDAATPTVVNGSDLGLSYLYLMKGSSTNGYSIQMNYSSSTDKNTGITTVKRSSLISTIGTEKAIKKITINLYSTTSTNNYNKVVLSMGTNSAVSHGVYDSGNIYNGTATLTQEFSFTEGDNFHFFGLIYKGTEKGAVYVNSIVIETY